MTESYLPFFCLCILRQPADDNVMLHYHQSQFQVRHHDSPRESLMPEHVSSDMGLSSQSTTLPLVLILQHMLPKLSVLSHTSLIVYAGSTFTPVLHIVHGNISHAVMTGWLACWIASG